jgi:hypothetical protein
VAGINPPTVTLAGYATFAAMQRRFNGKIVSVNINLL